MINMRSVFKALLGHLIAFGLLVGAYGLTIPASEDSVAYLNKVSAASNAAANLMVDANHKALIYFNTNDIPSDAVLRWAKLRLFLPSVRVRGSGLGVYVVTGTWNEAVASPIQPSIDPTRVGLIPPGELGTRRFVTVDVTSTVQSWISDPNTNEGFAIAPVTGGTAVASLYLTSKDGASLGLPAELDLEFKPAAVRLEDLSDSVRALLTAPGSTAEQQLPASLKALIGPVITTQANLLPDGLSLGAVVGGLGPFSYQWYKNGVAVSGGTSSTLSTVGLTSGAYMLSASNGFATVASGTFHFDPNPPIASFVLIPAGSYQRGDNLDAMPDAPVQAVSLSPYYMAVNNITQAQWDLVRTWAVGNGYTDLGVGNGKAIDHPVVGVNWYDAVKWANAASEKEGLTPLYTVGGMVLKTGTSNSVTCDWNANGYRLPTEAEWEVAARGGLTGKRFPLGDTLSQTQANYLANPGILYDSSGSANNYHPIYATGGIPYTSPVGSFAVNGYGLYDMAGNVYQWCWDWWAETAPGSDPQGAVTGTVRVRRGGGWDKDAASARCAQRGSSDPAAVENDDGFRLARSATAIGFPSVSQPVATGTAMTVNSQGAAPLSYQWLRNGVAVSGGTASILPLVGLTSGTYSVQVSNSIGMATSSGLGITDFMLPSQYRLISAGSYQIGNVIGDSDITDASIHTVNLSAFYIAVNDTTKAQWDTVRTWGLGRGYADLVEGAGKAATHPVQTVSWYDAVKWANAASEKDGLTPCYTVSSGVYRAGTIDEVACNWSANGYRLPTEAEWEVAARGGLSGKRFPLGDTISQDQANYYAYQALTYDLSRMASGYHPSYATGGAAFTSPAGSFEANGYGLCDMAGNVRQWCWDWYDASYASGTDPRGAVSGTKRVLRGGDWNYYADLARCAQRYSYAPPAANNSYGFRLARGRP